MSIVLATALLALGCAVLLASLDDVIIDILTFAKLKKPRIRDFTEADMGAPSATKPQIAIFVANWHEADVLGPMVQRNLDNFSYGPVKFVLGVYPNDTGTLAVAEKLSARYPASVEVIVNRRYGPTSKGQMLNEMFAQLYAKPDGAPDLVVLHDSEDVIAPHSFSVYARESRNHAMIQIPIFSIDSRHRTLVGATYMEEFAERHTREMLLREQLGAFVPSAGVGTCLRKDLILHFIAERGHVLQPGSVTEDYILGAEAHRAGFSTAFAAYRSPSPSGKGKGQIIATLEFFPKDFWASVRQRTRWTYGIGFEGAKRLGWFGSAWNRFFLYRDRKGAVANFIPCISLVLLALCLTVGPDFSEFTETQKGILFVVLGANSVNILLRIYQKAASLHEVYGMWDLLGLIARWPVAMVINAYAAGRAWRSYLVESARASKPIAWAKTQHELPAIFKLPGAAIPAAIAATAGSRRVLPRMSRQSMSNTLGGLTAAFALALIVAGGLRIQSSLYADRLVELAAQTLPAGMIEADQREKEIVARSDGATGTGRIEVASIGRALVADPRRTLNLRQTATALAEQSIASMRSSDETIFLKLTPADIEPEAVEVASIAAEDETDDNNDTLAPTFMPAADEANAGRTATAMAEFSLLSAAEDDRLVRNQIASAPAGETVEVAALLENATDTSPEIDDAENRLSIILAPQENANAQRTATSLAEFSLSAMADDERKLHSRIAMAGAGVSELDVAAAPANEEASNPAGENEPGENEAPDPTFNVADLDQERALAMRMANESINSISEREKSISSSAHVPAVTHYAVAEPADDAPSQTASMPAVSQAAAEPVRDLAATAVNEIRTAEAVVLESIRKNNQTIETRSSDPNAVKDETPSAIDADDRGGVPDAPEGIAEVEPDVETTDEIQPPVTSSETRRFVAASPTPQARTYTAKFRQAKKGSKYRSPASARQLEEKAVALKKKPSLKSKVAKGKAKPKKYAAVIVKAPNVILPPAKTIINAPPVKSTTFLRRRCRNGQC